MQITLYSHVDELDEHFIDGLKSLFHDGDIEIAITETNPDWQPIPNGQNHIVRYTVSELGKYVVNAFKAIHKSKNIRLDVCRIDGVRALLPREKRDVERAKAIATLDYPELAPYLGELIVWLQDANWPVSGIVANLLAHIGIPVVPEIRRVLESDDGIWEYHVLSQVVEQASPEVAKQLEPELVRIISHPTVDEKIENVNTIAQKILENLK